MSNAIARNLHKTHPTLFRLSLFLGVIYVLSGLDIFRSPIEEIVLRQPQSVILIGVLGKQAIGIISILLGLTHFYGLYRKSYKATMTAYIAGMAYLAMWSLSYFFLIPNRPGAVSAGLSATLGMMYLTMGAIRERIAVHNAG